jgi:hypothetical protein
MIGIQLGSILLLIYSCIFMYDFQIHGVASSYFPWDWNYQVIDPLVASNLFDLAVEVSLGAMIVSSILLFGYFLPGMKKLTLKNNAQLMRST